MNVSSDVDVTDTRNQFERVAQLVVAWLRLAGDTSENVSCAICLEDFEQSLGGKQRRSSVSTQDELSVLQRAQDFLARGRACSLFEAARAVVGAAQSSAVMQSPTNKKRKSTAGTGDNALVQAAINKLHKLESLHDRIAANEETLPRKFIHLTLELHHYIFILCGVLIPIHYYITNNNYYQASWRKRSTTSA